MNIRQTIRDFYAKFSSKYFWRELWLDIRAFPRKRVDAETLKKVCECINPPYSLMLERACRELNSNHGWNVSPDKLFNDPSVVNAFYNDREKFLDKKFLESIAGNIPSSFHEYLKEEYSPAKEKEKFDNLIGRRLRKNILLSIISESNEESDLLWIKKEGAGVQYLGVLNTPEVLMQHKRKAIEFVDLVIEGQADLNLCGKFDRWKFDNVKFLNGAVISVRPPFKILGGEGVTISNSFFGGHLDIQFVGVPRIRICDSTFIAPIYMRIRDTEDAWVPAVRKLVRDMKRSYLKDNSVPVIEFSGNHLDSIQLPTAINDTRFKYPDLGKVRFINGNHIGSLPMSINTYPRGGLINVDKKPVVPLGADVKFGDIHFSVQERIKKQLSLEMTLNHKKYFIALKNQAIEQRDREAEFNYGRQERYFDRLLATRWQDKFILGWSHYVSDSGISWIRPIGWLIAVQAILAAAFIGWNVWICPSDWSVGGWAKTVIESLNPLSKAESKCADSLSAPLYNVARKIFLFLFLYEAVKVFRRFSK